MKGEGVRSSRSYVLTYARRQPAPSLHALAGRRRAASTRPGAGPAAIHTRHGRPVLGGSDAMGRPARVSDHRRREQPMECPMPQRDDLSRSLTAFQQDSTLVAVVELSRSSWLVAGIVPGIGRHPLKKLASDEEALLRLLQRWRDEAAGAGRTITRLAVAFEAGRDGFWLAPSARARGVEGHVTHPA